MVATLQNNVILYLPNIRNHPPTSKLTHLWTYNNFISNTLSTLFNCIVQDSFLLNIHPYIKEPLEKP